MSVLHIDKCILWNYLATIRVMTDNLSSTSISSETNYRESTKPTCINFHWNVRYTWNPLSWNYATPNVEMKPCLSSFIYHRLIKISITKWYLRLRVCVKLAYHFAETH